MPDNEDTTGSPVIKSAKLTIKQERVDDEEEISNCHYSNRRDSRDDDLNSNTSGNHDDEAYFRETLADGDITVVRIPVNGHDEHFSYPRRVPVMYPMHYRGASHSRGSASPTGYRLEDNELAPDARRKIYEGGCWSESRQARKAYSPLPPSALHDKTSTREGDKRRNLFPTYAPEVDKAKHPNGFRKDARRERPHVRGEDGEEESLWKQVQRYRHRKRPVLGKLHIPSQEETIFMQYNEIRERRLREGRYLPREPCGRSETIEKEEPAPVSPPSHPSSDDDSNRKQVSEADVTSSNAPSETRRGENDLEEAPTMCNGDMLLTTITANTDLRMGESPGDLRTKPAVTSSNPAVISESDVVSFNSGRNRMTPSAPLPRPYTPLYPEVPCDSRRPPRSDTYNALCGRDAPYTPGGQCRHNNCSEYDVSYGSDECCHDHPERRRVGCSHHCCYPTEQKAMRKRRMSDPDEYWSKLAKTRASDSPIACRDSSPFQNETHSPSSSDSVDIIDSEQLRGSRFSTEDPPYECENSRESVVSSDTVADKRKDRGDGSAQMNEDDVVCQVNGLFSLPGYRETKYNISLGELKRRTGQPETLTRVEMISYVRQAKTSGRILLDKNSITTSNRSHPTIMSRVCEREAQVLACGLHKMNMEYLPLRKMAQRAVGVYRSRGCEGCQECRLRMRRKIVDVEITRNMLREMSRVTQESSYSGMLDAFDLASHTFGTPNLLNNIKLMDEYFRHLLLALDDEH
ncbi:uncharacterized protein LOC116613986 isoform X2 [Nematostella vectensis]|uniref:uncharacterized protein LOC116613986 isoform X2 n=1 Tax=Nematostella vectensis TaxID=45351 RepID=UPI0020771E53|nr:uncharacterized protein LOC116613986 isoform X2 [Nematostella vectensis]